jgi:cytochrome c oxidase accessory protein FixG
MSSKDISMNSGSFSPPSGVSDKAENFQETSFRDRPTTFSREGRRIWVYPNKPKGKFYQYRRLISWILLAFFFTAPWLKIGGEPLVLFNFSERKFVFFSHSFLPQDFHLLVLAVIASIVFIVLFTVVYGRIFCGWICPQTVFMEFLYRPIEFLIDGNSKEQKKLAESEITPVKAIKRIMKHSIFLFISLATILTFMAYVIGNDNVMMIVKKWPFEEFGIMLGVLIFTAIHYFVFAWFREQVCTMVCPYGRLQGVMLDIDTILVAYDYKRGEPRGKGENGQKGDCINCYACVEVCPTGIDIRNGTQLECINCTACIDACSAVMRKIRKPEGLIRFASERSINQGKGIRFNTRVFAYSVVLATLLILIIYLFSVRGNVEVNIIRAQGTMFQEYGTDKYSNLYNLELVNKTNSWVNVELKLISPIGEIILMGDSLKADKGEVAQRNLLIVLKKEAVTTSNSQLIIGIYEQGKLVDQISSTFVGPNSLDK